MGEVFRARDSRLHRDVAIKIVWQETTGDERIRHRVLREARAAAALSHPAIATIFSVEQVDELLFIVMELVEGGTLSDRLISGPLTALKTCDIGAQVADALAAAHAAGIIHHDITPRNILLTVGGGVKLVDFGLARAIAQQTSSLESATTGLHPAGTLHYMSPEQTRGERCTPSTDLFSLGSVLYQASTGRRPFDGPNRFAVMDAILTADPPRLSAVRPELPGELDIIMSRLLAKRVDDRFADAGQVADVFRHIGASLATSTRSVASVVGRRVLHSRTFVGREQELARLWTTLSRAVTGMGTLAVVTGEAGIGKTALMDEFLDRRETVSTCALVCRGQCIEYSGAGEAYLPVIDALTPYAGVGECLHDVIRAHAPSWICQFRAAFHTEETSSPRPSTERLVRELGDALCAAASARPIILVLEDLHWADPSTVDLLLHLAHRVRRAALLIIATCRLEEASMSGSHLHEVLLELEARRIGEVIELGGLSEADIRKYLDSRFRFPETSLHLASVLAAATDGQPLFIISLVQLFLDRGDLYEVNREWRLAVPAGQLQLDIPRTVRAVIRRKLFALDKNDRRLLQHASVEGQEFSTAVVAPLLASDPAELEERLHAMAQTRLVTPVGPESYPDGSWGARYRFAHAMYQHVVYEELTPSRRAHLHRQVAERLVVLHAGQTARIAAQLARHFREGRDIGRAYEQYVQAGDNAISMSAGFEADEHYTQAIGLATTQMSGIERKRLAIVYRKRAVARGVFLGRVDDAISDHYRELACASAIEEADLMFDARYGLAFALLVGERMNEAACVAADITQSVERSSDGSKRLRALILATQLHMGRGDLDQAALAADSAIALARSLEDRKRLWNCVALRAQLDFYRTDYEAALPALRDVCAWDPLTYGLTDPRTLHSRFHGTFFLGLTLINLGHFSEALATLRPGLEAARREGHRYWIAPLLNSIGDVYRELGVLDAAVSFDQEAVDPVSQVAERRAHSYLNLAEDYCRVRQLDRVPDLLHAAQTFTKEDGWLSWLLRIRLSFATGEYWLARGEPARAAEFALQSNTLAGRHGAWKHVILATKTLAEAASAEGKGAAACSHVKHALDALAAHPVPLIAWTVHATAGRIYRTYDEHERGAAATEAARSEVSRLSENILEEPLKAAFLNSPPVRAILYEEPPTANIG